MAFELFAKEATIESVMQATGRTRKTVLEYLCDFITETRPASIGPWVSADVYAQVQRAAREVGIDKLKPIFVTLGEKIPYDDIHIVRAHLRAQTKPAVR
jgi:hypothetical protein